MSISIRLKVFAASICLVASLPGFAGAALADAPATPDVRIGTEDPGSKALVATATDAAGNSVVIWQSAVIGSSTDNGVIAGRCFAADGSERAQRIAIAGPVRRAGLDVAMNASGSFVVVYQGVPGGNQLHGDLMGQRFDAGCNPLGNAFVINQGGSGYVWNIRVAMNSTGAFAVSWDLILGLLPGPVNFFLAPEESIIYLRRYSAAAVPLGVGEIVSSQFAELDRFDLQRRTFQPAVAINDRGAIVVAYQRGDNHNEPTIFARRYTSLGLASGAQFQVSTNGSLEIRDASGRLTGIGLYPKRDAVVGIDAAGNFLVAWDGSTPEGPAGVFGRRYDATGTALSPEFLVNVPTPETATANGPAVTMDAAGQTVVAWTSGATPPFNNPDDTVGDIVARRYDGSGVVAGAQFRVNSSTGVDFHDAAVALSANGRIVFAWQSGSTGVNKAGCCTP